MNHFHPPFHSRNCSSRENRSVPDGQSVNTAGATPILGRAAREPQEDAALLVYCSARTGHTLRIPRIGGLCFLTALLEHPEKGDRHTSPQRQHGAFFGAGNLRITLILMDPVACAPGLVCFFRTGAGAVSCSFAFAAQVERQEGVLMADEEPAAR
jgi:hypothetical protein